eukprot:TRINITY_DN9930_c0_g1_i1.p1 TRINITY_DN9930_c0_g1~~TRINITY_DN9930_c0_g1_i1.p1  ORF type:complete len:389 (-),score=39.19 TRINITY_DN9930_c0_g1_i1:66-1232(-)
MTTVSISFTEDPKVVSINSTHVRMRTVVNCDARVHCNVQPPSSFLLDAAALLPGSASADCLPWEPCYPEITRLFPETSYSIYCVPRTSDGKLAAHRGPVLVSTARLAFMAPPVLESTPERSITPSEVRLRVTLDTTAAVLCGALDPLPAALPPTAHAWVTNARHVNNKTCVAGIECGIHVEALVPNTEYDIICVMFLHGFWSDISPAIRITAAPISLGVVTTEGMPSELIIRTSVNKGSNVTCALYGLGLGPTDVAALLNATVRGFSFCEFGKLCVVTVGNLEPRSQFDAYCVAHTHLGGVSAISGPTPAATGFANNRRAAVVQSFKAESVAENQDTRLTKNGYGSRDNTHHIGIASVCGLCAGVSMVLAFFLSGRRSAACSTPAALV